MMRLYILTLFTLTESFYLPGVVPRQFLPDELVPVRVNSLKSVRTHLPYNYYDLPFCKPDEIKRMYENLGEILAGDDIKNSPYELYMDRFETCKVLCRKKYDAKEVASFKEKIDEEYSVNWVVDNLPAATVVELPGYQEDVVYEHGYYLGGHQYKDGASALDAALSSEDIDPKVEAWYLNNHISITIKTHSDSAYDGKRVVQVEVEPKSILHSHNDWKEGEEPSHMTVETECVDPEQMNRPAMIIDGKGVQKNKDGDVVVVWTYDVSWEPSEIHWASRWDIYLSMNDKYDDEIHWFGIVNSLFMVFLLTGLIAIIMMRTLKKDVSYYNRVLTEEERLEEQEESGWKLIHGDVFRSPPLIMLFSVLVGNSTQLFGMACVTLIFAALGFLSPANRGSLMIALIVLFVLMGSPAGFTAAKTYKNLGGTKWQKTILLTALGFPSLVFSVFFVVNLAVWYEGASSAVPFGSMFALLALWFGISVPLTFLGAFFAFRKEKYEPATAVSPYPRSIPKVPWYLKYYVTIPIAGMLPFGAVFVEIYIIMTSIWMDQFYYVYGFLVMVFGILLITCAEITIVIVYFQLCTEDYRWWWRSFFTGGCVAMYVWIYSLYYFYTQLDMMLFVSGVVYFAYMSIGCLAIFMITGLVGYYSTYWFVHIIYGALKVD